MGFLLVCADINVGISDPDLTVMLQVQLQVMVGRNATIEHNKTAHAQRIPKKNRSLFHRVHVVNQNDSSKVSGKVAHEQMRLHDLGFGSHPNISRATRTAAVEKRAHQEVNSSMAAAHLGVLELASFEYRSDSNNEGHGKLTQEIMGVLKFLGLLSALGSCCGCISRCLESCWNTTKPFVAPVWQPLNSSFRECSSYTCGVQARRRMCAL